MTPYHYRVVDRWRSSFNPFRGLTMARVVQMLEEGERGAYADLQWLYRMVEKRDATLRAVRRRLRAALLKLDWNIKISDKTPKELQPLAAQQQVALRQVYDQVENLREALGFLASAEFRGYAHLERIQQGDVLVRLEPIAQWHWCRDGIYGAWQFNPQATSGLTTGEPMPDGRFIVREVEDPINEIAVIAFVRKSLSQKDWDGFIEVFGIPWVFLLAPEGVPDGDLAKWQEVADRAISDSRGALPAGSDVKEVGTGSRGVNPFDPHVRYQDEQIVLAGTSGKLTMLTASTGMNSGQADAHEDTFDEIAVAQAMEISEILQEQIDKPLLARLFPGQPVLAYFELAAQEQSDIDAEFERAVKATQAGYRIGAAELSERTGYALHDAPPPAQQAVPFTGFNREGADDVDETFEASARAQAVQALAQDLAPLRSRLEDLINELGDDADPADVLARLEADLPGLFKAVRQGGNFDSALLDILATAAVNGAEAAASEIARLSGKTPGGANDRR